MKKTASKRTKTKWIILGSIVLLLIAARLSLSYFVTRYVNNVLADIDGYYGTIDGVKIQLFRGAYVIDSLKLFKVNGNERVPFVNIPKSDLSVEWRALFEGSIVGEAIFHRPVINFIGGNKDKENNQSGANVDWTEPIKKLTPFDVNRLEVKHGTLVFHDFTTKPNVDVSLENVDLLATNLNNARKQKERLPSQVKVTATSIGGGLLTMEMGINVLKEIPDLDMNLKFENVNMPALNDFFKAYARVDVEKGVFNLYSEMAVNDGIITGYVKPIAQGVKLVDLGDEDGPIDVLWETVVGAIKDVFKNQKENQLATRVPLQGNLNNVRAGVWPTIWNVFSNAFVQAFDHSTDNTVRFADKGAPPDAKPENKREARKRERQERRAEKKAKN